MKRLLRLLVWLAPAVLAAQQPAENLPPPVRVDDAGRAHFHFTAPGARDVKLVSWSLPRAPEDTSNAPPTAAMMRSEDGSWTYTWGPLEPGIYEYRYLVDGLNLRDPRVLDRSTINWSVFTVAPREGAQPLWVTRATAARGARHLLTYRSHVTGEDRELVVYTPPGYENAPADRRYPVLFLLHGSGGEAGSWTSPVGRAHTSLDNLIADGATPRVVVMPDGHVRRDGRLLERREANRIFYEEFFTTIVPLVQERYRVAAAREHWAIAGLSMGGGHTLALALREPARFAHVGIFSSGVGSGWSEEDSFQKLRALAGQPEQHRPAHFWLACGRTDFARANADRLAEALRANRLPFSFYEDDSGHSWSAWRDFLPRFLRRLDASAHETSAR